MSCGMSGPNSTTLALLQCQGTCSMVSVTLGCAVTRSLRLLPCIHTHTHTHSFAQEGEHTDARDPAAPP